MTASKVVQLRRTGENLNVSLEDLTDGRLGFPIDIIDLIQKFVHKVMDDLKQLEEVRGKIDVAELRGADWKISNAAKELGGEQARMQIVSRRINTNSDGAVMTAQAHITLGGHIISTPTLYVSILA